MKPAERKILVMLLLAVLGAGCQQRKGYGRYASGEPESQFRDQVATNTEPPEDAGELSFRVADGSELHLADYRDKKNVVLVFMRGFSSAGALCPFCTAQSSRLIANYSDFQARGAEVLLVYPGSKEHLEEFLTAAKTQSKTQLDRVPFPVLLDEDLRAVDFFNIRHDLAHPSTYILDRAGEVRFAYVGGNISDRPSIKAMLQQLDRLGEKQ